MSFNPLILGRVRHSRMLLAGIQAEFGLDPRLKHSGVTVLGVDLFTPAQFSKECMVRLSSPQATGTKNLEIDISESLNFVLFVSFVVLRFWLRLCALRLPRYSFSHLRQKAACFQILHHGCDDYLIEVYFLNFRIDARHQPTHGFPGVEIEADLDVGHL